MKSIECKLLETERLILRKFEVTDANDMYNNWATDEDSVIQMPWQLHSSLEETKNILKTWVELYKNEYFYKWVIYSKEDKTIIGDISVIKLSVSNNCCEVGYILGSKWWNKGYMTEALKMVLKFLMNEVGINLVCASHDVKNPASGRVMEKALMKYEATLRDRYKRKDGTYADLKIYSITKEEMK